MGFDCDCSTVAVLLNLGPAGCHLRGDLNCDGRVNSGDIGPLVLALTDPAGYETSYSGCDIVLADMNEDEAVDGRDVQPFVEAILD